MYISKISKSPLYYADTAIIDIVFFGFHPLNKTTTLKKTVLLPLPISSKLINKHNRKNPDWLNSCSTHEN